MLERNDNGKKIEEYTLKEQYGIDISNSFQKKVARNRKRKIIFIFSFIILVIFSLVSCWSNLVQIKYKMARMSALKSPYQMNFKEKTVNVDLKGNGFITYELEEIPDIEIHALSKDDYTFIEDVESRIYKYFFEKWEDKDKYKFIVAESYTDYTYQFITKKNWILNYKTYIEVNNYKELQDATELIIKFRNYMQYPNIIVKSYIKFNEKFILPHNVSDQTDEEIRNSSQNQYLKILQEMN